jgi:sugar-specific transcriptional regulator TrmB
MSISENTRDTLREMGLNACEVDAYVVLLEGGQMTAMEISREASVPYSKIYEVEATASTKLRLEDKYQSWESTVAEELQPLYEKRELIERPDMLILRGQQAVLTKLEEVLTKATKEIMVAAPEFARSILTSADPLMSGLKKTVSVKLMVAGKAEEWLFLKKLPVVSELRVRDHMFGGGVIADGKEAMLFLGEDKPSLVIWSNHVGLVGFAREYFQFLWDSSAKA